jgi:hypothetical protein
MPDCLITPVSGAYTLAEFSGFIVLVAAGTCRLSWYEQAPPSFGNKVLCSGGDSTCLEPCSSGYELLQGTGLCLQKCPDKAAGPAQLCAPSRTCVRGDSTCPVLAEVPYLCTAPDEFIGEACGPPCSSHASKPYGVDVCWAGSMAEMVCLQLLVRQAGQQLPSCCLSNEDWLLLI